MSTAPQIYFNPWDPEFRANPYPYYAPLLAGPPPVIELAQKIALIARYAIGGIPRLRPQPAERLSIVTTAVRCGLG